MRDKREGAGFNCESPETMMPCEAREETGSRLAGNITKGQGGKAIKEPTSHSSK